MSEFLGSTISLISKSDIRYVGVLHAINSDESTVSLENVRSFGTEGRRGRPEDEIAPSDQVYEYIVFRGSDVKDLRIEETPTAKESQPPPVPDDPAILGSRPRQAAAPSAGPPGGPGPAGAPPAFGQNPYQPNFYGGPPGPWGRGGGPAPGPGFGMPFPPHQAPPGWFPPGGFPPAGPGAWNFPYPPGPPGPGMQMPDQNQRTTPSMPQDAKQGPTDKPKAAPGFQAAPPTEPKSSAQPQASLQGPTPPVDSKPSLEEVKATAANVGITTAPSKIPDGPKAAATGPKNGRVAPAMPLRGANAKPGQSSASTSFQAAVPTSGPPSAAALRDATEAAKAAVAIAMANLNANAGPAAPSSNGGAVDNLTKKVNEMRINANQGRGAPHSRAGRARGVGNRAAPVNLPEADFDFATANAKFSKADLAKEVTASSPLTESAPEDNSSVTEPEGANPPPAYNKSRSFFDNISSESKERAENNGQKAGGREWRGEEQRKNMETFGQGSVDGGYRNFRGRGRGRGGPRGRGFSMRGGGMRGGGRGLYNPRDNVGSQAGQQ